MPNVCLSACGLRVGIPARAAFGQHLAQPLGILRPQLSLLIELLLERDARVPLGGPSARRCADRCVVGREPSSVQRLGLTVRV